VFKLSLVQTISYKKRVQQLCFSISISASSQENENDDPCFESCSYVKILKPNSLTITQEALPVLNLPANVAFYLYRNESDETRCFCIGAKFEKTVIPGITYREIYYFQNNSVIL